MKLVRRTLICTVVSLTGLATSFAQQVQTDFDHRTDFSQYRTYNWEQVKPANSLWTSRIKNAVDQQLAAKGWALADQNADVAVMAIENPDAANSGNVLRRLRWRLGMARVRRLRRRNHD